MNQNPKTMSASQLASALGDQLPRVEELPPGASELAEVTRDLVAAVVASDIDDASRQDLARQIRTITAQLRAKQRDPLIFLARHRNGWTENLTQAGSGWWNPQAPRIKFDPAVLRKPKPGSPPHSVEVTAKCTLTEAHSGPPDRAHGGIVVTLLDEALGAAAIVAGSGGMTAGLNIRFKTATPLDVPLELRARYERSDGRKNFVSGELVADEVVTATAEGVFIAPKLED